MPLVPAAAATSGSLGGSSQLPNASQNLAAFFESSDDREDLKKLLLLFAERDPVQCFKLLRKGFEASFAEKCEQNTNQGIMAALIVSVLLAMSVELPNVNLADDGWMDHRQSMLDAYAYLCLLGSGMGLIAVILSMYWVNVAKMYVIDVDDFIWFVMNQRIKAIEVCTNGSVLCCALAMANGFVVITSDPVASIGFFTVLILLLVTLAFVVVRLFAASKHYGTTVDKRMSKMREIIGEVSQRSIG